MPLYLEKACSKSIGEVLGQFAQSKADRDSKLDAIRSDTAEAIEGLKDTDPVRQLVSSNSKALPTSFKALTKKLMRQQIVKDGKRVDGRTLDEVRPISAAAGVLPKRVHGSGLFQRGPSPGPAVQRPAPGGAPKAPGGAPKAPGGPAPGGPPAPPGGPAPGSAPPAGGAP